jgi:hypothetical protein
MRHALERMDVSENVARRKRFEFVTLAGVACGLIGFSAFAGAAPLRLVSDHELKRAVLFVFRKRAGPLLITADTRDERTYQAALDEAMAAVRRDESGTESGFAGLEGEGSTRSR